MPANLPPQYFDTEKKLKTAKTAEEKISIMEELLSIIPKHKGTEKLQALYKTKIAKLRAQKDKKPATARHGPTSHIDKAGAGQLVLVGPPNTGKSQLIQALTNANPEIGDYPFTTHAPSPAMMPFENIQIQLIDMPPITPEFFEPWQAELIKGADAVLIVLDLDSQDTERDYRILCDRIKEKNIEIVPASRQVSQEKWYFWKRSVIVANKVDRPDSELNLLFLKEKLDPEFEVITVSALHGDGVEDLRQRIFATLNVVRVYSKEPGKKADTGDPFIFQKGETLMDMAKAVHKDFAQKLKFARIWGKAKYEGQKVNQDYLLQDEDVIELHI
ncbi:MAG: 50S ribosome-binding GTPase [Candidatus Aminicenantes bacterium]|nr:50S ribosome-binding GTPase [Candidatus Aminicenantes bacterium]